MALKWDKYDIKVQNENAIKRNQIFLNFMQNKRSIIWMEYICMKKVF